MAVSGCNTRDWPVFGAFAQYAMLVGYVPVESDANHALRYL